MSVTDTASKFPHEKNKNRLLDAMRKRTLKEKESTSKKDSSSNTTYSTKRFATSPNKTKRL